MTPIRCIVFDFDGVLAQSNALKRRAYFEIFADLTHTPSIIEAVLLECQDCDRYQVIEGILARLAKDGGAPVGEPKDLATRYAAAYSNICEIGAVTCPEVPGASAVLAQLSGRYPLYVASGTPEEPLRRIVQQRGWNGHFREVLGRPRSKEANLARVMERERLTAEELLLVGDSRPDERAALAIGCRFIGVRSDLNDFESLPAVMIDDLHGLAAAMRPWSGVK